MNEIHDHDELRFEPWLLQTLEKVPDYDKREFRCTAEEARTAHKNQEDPLKWGKGLARKVAQYIDDRTVWHYMGNAEYEFGSIPQAIQYLFDQDLTTAEFTIPKEKLPRNFSRGNMNYHAPAKRLWEEKQKKSGQDKELMKQLKAEIDAGPQNDLLLYYLGPKKYLKHLPGMLDKLCKGSLRTKAGTCFAFLADPISDYDKKYHGWLCLDRPFWMTTDKVYFDALTALYLPEAKVAP
jgi:hypothetical protein